MDPENKEVYLPLFMHDSASVWYQFPLSVIVSVNLLVMIHPILSDICFADPQTLESFVPLVIMVSSFKCVNTMEFCLRLFG